MKATSNVQPFSPYKTSTAITKIPQLSSLHFNLSLFNPQSGSPCSHNGRIKNPALEVRVLSLTRGNVPGERVVIPPPPRSHGKQFWGIKINVHRVCGSGPGGGHQWNIGSLADNLDAKWLPSSHGKTEMVNWFL
ncbi:hypothetical protein CEXT_476781 [Caerostris extrusa]|uniref:Uncharacterized protein n=1 Tax=Caerostris extrusa TaxID=172846 RepID=A0AAV4VI61_CAEEX|nr:hypothetical protein CEXT_476781 [Caerostris extrusa]